MRGPRTLIGRDRGVQIQKGIAPTGLRFGIDDSETRKRSGIEYVPP
jgi:hypothetical protein